MTERFISETLSRADAEFDLTLRPGRFADFVGQAKIRERLELSVAAATGRGDALDHVLLCGPPGLGKTTLAYILGAAMGANVKATSGPIIDKPADLAGMLTNLEKGDVLFIDEIHRIQKSVEEYLYSAMEDFVIDIVIDQGANARSVRLNLPRFTLVGATTRSGLLTAPLRSRFGMTNRLDYYTAAELCQVVTRSARILNVDIEDEGAEEIAARSRGTPRIANNLLRWVRDYAQVRADNRITREVADQALAMLDIDAPRPGRDGQAHPVDDHRQVRRRPGRHQHPRGLGGRGARHDRGGLRALPDPAGAAGAHAAGPHRHRLGLPVAGADAPGGRTKES